MSKPEIFSYYTISNASEGVFKDRGSKFFAFAFPVVNEEQIKKHLISLRKKHPSARHHCYAWCLGSDSGLTRTHDDGEPSNSAGKPILTQITSHHLTNVLVVVIRYFGGTLLGVSGLINAYKNATADVIRNSKIEECFIYYLYKIEFGFEDLSSVMKLLKEKEAKIISNQYHATNVIVCQVRKRDSEKFASQLGEIYRAKFEYLNSI